MSSAALVKRIYYDNQSFLDILCTLSALLCTIILTLNYSVLIIYNGYTADHYVVRAKYAFIAMCIAVPIYIFLIFKKKLVGNILERISVGDLYIALFFTVSIVVKMISDTKRNYSHIKESSLGKILNYYFVDEHHEIGIVISCVMCGIAVLIVALFVCLQVRNIIFEFLLPMESYEKKYIMISFFTSIFFILYFYQRATGQWSSLDLVYQTDTIFLYKHYYPVFSYGYDFDWDIGNGGIRHPLATLITFPIYVVVFILSNLLFFIPNITAILYAISNAILLILTVVLLVRITNVKWLYVIFSLSYPFTFYLVFLEKYQLAVFFSVLFLYLVKIKADNKLQGTTLIASSGIMITSAICGFFYGKSTTLIERIKEYFSIFFIFIATLIVSGRISYILNFLYLKDQNYIMFFDNPNGTFSEKINNYSNMVVSCFVPIPYEATDRCFFWSNYNTYFNPLFIIILMFVIVAFFKHKKNIEVRAFSLWIIWSVLQLILGVNSPLFNLYFAWAIIPMALLGIEALLKNRQIKNTFYILLTIAMLYSNYYHMMDVLNYLVLKTPL